MWVGSKSVSGHFTVHKVEQLNLKKRELAGVYKILRRNWSLFEFSFCVGSFYISAAWLGLLLIFFSDGGHEDYFSHEFKSWKKKRYFPPNTSHSSDCGDRQTRMHSVLTSCSWDLCTLLFIEKSALRRDRLFPSDSCSAFIVMILLGVTDAG